MNKIIIIGNSISGITVAEEIRKADPSSKITIISNEESNSYFRTRLCDFLIKEWTFGDLKFKSEDFYSANNIEIFLNNPVTRIDFEGKKISLQERQKFAYDKLVIATGKSIYVPKDLKGHRKTNIFKLNTFKDAELIKERLALGGHVCVWGSCMLAIHLALLANKRGADVKLISASKTLLPGILNRFCSDVVEEILVSKGIDVILNRNVTEILGNGEVNSVKIDSGKVFAAEMVLATENFQANMDFLKESTIEIDKGILVDKHLQTSIDSVFAVGEVAQFKKQEFRWFGWEECANQAKVAAANILGQDAKYETKDTPLELELTDLNIVAWGDLDLTPGARQICLRSANTFRFANLKENKILGFALINDNVNKDKFFEAARKESDFRAIENEFMKTDNIISSDNVEIKNQEGVPNAEASN